jgi:glycosyltransferase involved in cell wall biosynthesis
VVGTAAGGVAELIENGVSGLLVTPANPDALAQAMLRIMRDGALRARLGPAARARIIGGFSAARSADALARALDA